MTDHKAPMGLQKEITLPQLFTLAFGTIIGVGWITVLGSLLGQAGSLGTVLGFAGGGVMIVLIGFCYAEIGTMYPASGGEVVYAYKIFGVKASFLAGWFLALSYIAVTTFEAVSVGWIASTLLPGIDGPVLYSVLGDDVRLGSLILGLGGMVIITYLNYRGAKSAATFQDIMTYGLIIVSLVFISAGLIHGEIANLEPEFIRNEEGSIWPGVLAVVATAPFFFAGFNTIPQAMGEVSVDSDIRLVGRVMILTILASIMFYCLVVLASAMALPRDELLSMDLPAAAAFEAAFQSKRMGQLVLFAGFLGLITSWNAIFFAASRVLFAMGRGCIIPPGFGKVHQTFGSPATAVLFVGAVGFLGVFLGKNVILPAVNLIGTCISFMFLIVSIGVIRERRRRPDAPRPYRVPGGQIVAALAVLSSAAMIVVALRQPYLDAGGNFPLEWAVLLGWGGLGAVFWFAAGKVRRTLDPMERAALMLGEAPAPASSVVKTGVSEGE